MTKLQQQKVTFLLSVGWAVAAEDTFEVLVSMADRLVAVGRSGRCVEIPRWRHDEKLSNVLAARK